MITFNKLNQIDQIVFMAFKGLSIASNQIHKFIFQELQTVYKNGSWFYPLVSTSGDEDNKSLYDIIFEEIKNVSSVNDWKDIEKLNTTKEGLVKTFFLKHYIGPFANVEEVAKYILANKKFEFVLVSSDH